MQNFRALVAPPPHPHASGGPKASPHCEFSDYAPGLHAGGFLGRHGINK